ncbi:DUF2513 domain-containing protein [Lysobacter sp. P5_B9]
MQRNMDLIRQVLLSAEAGPPYPSIEDYPPQAVRYHQMLAIDAGLAKGLHRTYQENATDIPDVVVVQGITWQGHDFLAAVRDDNNWAKLKKFLVESGKAVTLETLIAGAKVLFGFAA